MKTRNIILAATFIAATIGLTAFKTVHSDRPNAPLKNTQAASNLDETADDSEAPYPCSEQRCKDSFGYIIVEPGNDGKTYLKITNETGKGICVHANVYINGKEVPVYGYVPEWANTKKMATYIFWSYNRFSLRDVSDEKYHTDHICPKNEVSLY